MNPLIDKNTARRLTKDVFLFLGSKGEPLWGRLIGLLIQRTDEPLLKLLIWNDDQWEKKVRGDYLVITNTRGSRFQFTLHPFVNLMNIRTEYRKGFDLGYPEISDVVDLMFVYSKRLIIQALRFELYDVIGFAAVFDAFMRKWVQIFPE